MRLEITMDKNAKFDLARAVGKTIAKKRVTLGLSQQQLAERLHIGDEAISRIERGTVIPNVARLSALADVFECGMDELIGKASNRASDQGAYLNNLLSRLKEGDREMMLDVIEKLVNRLTKKSTPR